MRRASGILVALLFATGLAGCQMHPVPLSAQKGSTIIIPLSKGGVQLIGYGGTEYADPQRGTMVYQLEGTDPVVELTTRFTAAAWPHPASPIAQNGYSNTTESQVFSVVDLVSPDGTNVPEGTYDLEVFRRLDDGENISSVQLEYNGTIKILPQTVTVDGPNGPEDIVGTPNPDTVLNNGGGFVAGFQSVAPRPRIRLRLRSSGGEPPIAAFELELRYPDGVIDVVEAAQSDNTSLPPNARSTVWMEDDDAGTAKISAVPHPEGGAISSWVLDVAFELVDDAAPLDLDAHLADGTLEVPEEWLTAYDIDGQEIPNAYVADFIQIR